ncbi:MAG: choice-of-anchor O protein [Kofleriaceae bacterium]
MSTTHAFRLAFPIALCIAGIAHASGPPIIQFTPPIDQPPAILSTSPDVGVDGAAAFKGRIVRSTFQTTPTSGVYQTAVVVAYEDAAGPEVWEWDGARHGARDLFVTRSLDGGLTWSTPINLTQTAALSSRDADPDGSGPLPAQPYRGSVDKAAMVGSGKQFVIVYPSYYCPSGQQGSVRYMPPEAGNTEIPYSCIYAVRSSDAGATWSAPQQLTTGSRHAMNVSLKQSSMGFGAVWQEDPNGLRPGEGEGPGDGGSGANVSKGTDIWYASIAKTQFAAGFGVAARVTDNAASIVDGRETGPAGASRPNLTFVGSRVAIVYEEHKNAPGEAGKLVRYHTFDGFAFGTILTPASTSVIDDGTAGAGYIVSNPLRNARRARITSQEMRGPTTGLAMILQYREGELGEGGPADAMARTGRIATGDPGSNGLRPEDMWPAVAGATTFAAASGNAPALNLSSRFGITADTEADAIENARGHRAIMRGDEIAMAYHYTSDDAASKMQLANYNLFIRRSLDGGQTWEVARNVSNITDLTINVREPRLVATPSSPDPSETQNTDVLHVAWGTITNAREDLGQVPVNLGVYYTRTTDFGATYERVQELSGRDSNIGDDNESEESQLQSNAAGTEVHIMWMFTSATADDVAYRRGTVGIDEICTGDYTTGDTDGDAVCNDLDQCTGSDASGDADNDRVCDDLDLCAGDDALGDPDGDGVCGEPDVTPPPDAGGNDPDPHLSGGCGCRSAGGSSWLLAIGPGLLLMRRRRSRR